KTDSDTDSETDPRKLTRSHRLFNPAPAGGQADSWLLFSYSVNTNLSAFAPAITNPLFYPKTAPIRILPTADCGLLYKFLIAEPGRIILFPSVGKIISNGPHIRRELS
ncbi:MAG: hypothetical protein JXR49_06680, partial [Acidobacteria bacterium]|nr:hypothetical protein [Acidobacteriota bacterium]